MKTRLGEVSVVIQGLKVPWGVGFSLSGEALVGERDSAEVSRIGPTGADRLPAPYRASSAPAERGAYSA